MPFSSLAVSKLLEICNLYYTVMWLSIATRVGSLMRLISSLRLLMSWVTRATGQAIVMFFETEIKISTSPLVVYYYAHHHKGELRCTSCNGLLLGLGERETGAVKGKHF